MAVSADDVTWAYRLVLGREPESPEVIQLWMNQPSTQALLYAFIQSSECRDRALVQVPDSFVYETEFDVEMDCEPNQLGAMLDRIQAAWATFGQGDAYWSVITNPNFSADRIEDFLEPFFATGRDTARRVIATLLRNQIDTAKLTRVLDFGCGVGRITFALAEHFDHVIGADISEGHLRLARERGAALASANTNFHQIKSVDDIDAMAQFDLVVSFIVLQHNPPPVAVAILTKLLKRLNPGGIAVFQIPTFINRYRFDLDDIYLQNSLKWKFTPSLKG